MDDSPDPIINSTYPAVAPLQAGHTGDKALGWCDSHPQLRRLSVKWDPVTQAEPGCPLRRRFLGGRQFSGECMRNVGFVEICILGQAGGGGAGAEERDDTYYELLMFVGCFDKLQSVALCGDGCDPRWRAWLAMDLWRPRVSEVHHNWPIYDDMLIYDDVKDRKVVMGKELRHVGDTTMVVGHGQHRGGVWIFTREKA